VCTIGNNVAVDMTGLVATQSGYVVIDGKNSDWALRVAYLDSKCHRTATQTYPNGLAVDPQDIAVDSKGTLWIADTGDDPVTPQRNTVSLWKVTSKSSMTRYKFAYPDGPHNVEALVLNGNGAPIFVTKQITGAASIYTFTGTLASGTTMTLTKVGTFTPEQTGTANKLGNRGPAQNEVTGGANSPDGSRVVLRTLTDAYEWDVTNGNVVAAITKGKPRITPMPNEAQGYAIAYTTDGASFLTVSDTSSATPMLKYKPATPVAVAAAKKAAKGPKAPSALRKWFNGLTFSQLMWLLAGVAAFGFVLLMIGVLGIRRSRRMFGAQAARGRSGDDDPRAPAAVGGSGVYGSARSAGPGGGTVYGGDRHGGASDPYAAPTSPPVGKPPSGGVYSGGQYSGGHGGPNYPPNGPGNRPEDRRGGNYGSGRGDDRR
jgi:hypothetical protein